VQRLQCLLLDGLDANLTDLGVAVGAQQRHAVGRVRLVSKAKAFHVCRRQQPHRNPLALQAAAPVVRRPTSLHDDLADLAIGKEPLKLRARQAVRTSDVPSRISLRHLEDGLCKIDRNGCSIHAGLLSLKT
jgi:hypothetical protein